MCLFHTAKFQGMIGLVIIAPKDLVTADMSFWSILSATGYDGGQRKGGGYYRAYIGRICFRPEVLAKA